MTAIARTAPGRCSSSYSSGGNTSTSWAPSPTSLCTSCLPMDRGMTAPFLDVKRVSLFVRNRAQQALGGRSGYPCWPSHGPIV